jgi:hypothetical protein
MLKNASSFVLGIKKSSTSPRGYASGFFIPAALLETFLSILAVLSQNGASPGKAPVLAGGGWGTK